MSWVARKLAMTDDVDQQHIIQEYFEQKAEKAVQDKLIAAFWKEMQEDERGA